MWLVQYPGECHALYLKSLTFIGIAKYPHQAISLTKIQLLLIKFKKIDTTHILCILSLLTSSQVNNQNV